MAAARWCEPDRRAGRTCPRGRWATRNACRGQGEARALQPLVTNVLLDLTNQAGTPYGRETLAMALHGG